VRTLRPEVILTQDPAPRPGQHGNHQAAGVLAIEAFDAAADPAAPEAGDAAVPPADAAVPGGDAPVPVEGAVPAGDAPPADQPPPAEPAA